MALPAAPGAWQLAHLSGTSDLGGARIATIGPSFVDEQKGGVVGRTAQRIPDPIFLKSLFAVTVTSFWVVYMVLRCFRNVPLDPTGTAGPRTLAEGGPHEKPCSDWPDAGARDGVTISEGGSDESGTSAVRRPVAGASALSVATHRSQQREGKEKGQFRAERLSGSDAPALPSALSSHWLNPVGPRWLISPRAPRYAGLPAGLSPFSAFKQGPQQSMRPFGREQAAVSVDPATFQGYRPCAQQPGEPQQAEPLSQAWSALGARQRTSPQEQPDLRPVKWKGPDEEGWGYRALPNRYKSMNLRVLRDLEKVAVTCVALTPSLKAQDLVLLAAYVSSMAALELSALAYCPDDVQPRRAEVCKSYATLLTSVTAEGSGTLQAARDMGLLKRMDALVRVLKEIGVAPPKTERIPLETYKIKHTTQMRMSWYAFEAVQALLDGLFPLAPQCDVPTQKPQNVITACESFYKILKERLLASFELRHWLLAAQLKALTWVVIGESEFAKQPKPLKKIAEAQEDIDRAIVEAGCSPVVFGPHQATLKAKVSSVDTSPASSSLQQLSGRLSAKGLQPVQSYSSTTSLGPGSVFHTGIKLPHQLQQQSLPRMWLPRPLIEAPLLYGRTHVQPAQRSHHSVPAYILRPFHFPHVQRPLQQALRHEHHQEMRPFALPLPLPSQSVVPSRLPFREPAGFYNSPHHPLHQPGWSRASHEQFKTLLDTAEGIKAFQGSQPSHVPRTPAPLQLPPSPWTSPEQQPDGWPAPTVLSSQHAAALPRAVSRPPPGFPDISTSVPEAGTARVKPSLLYTPVLVDPLSPLDFPAYGWSSALEERAASEIQVSDATIPPQSPAHVTATAPSLFLPWTTPIWAWSPAEQHPSSWPHPEAFLSRRVTSEAFSQSAADMWGSGTAALEAELTEGDSLTGGEGERVSSLKHALDIFSIDEDEDD
ncbi:hypothetical protein ACSSS7_003184 [Eimeria intestinalis]